MSAAGELFPPAPAVGPGRLRGAAAVRAYLLAGRATLTLVSTKTGARYTYSVRQAADTAPGAGPWHVGLLTGPDNERSYTYLGTVFLEAAGPVYKTGQRSTVAPDAPSALAARWLVDQVRSGGAKLEQVEVWHCGRCGRCGRKLTVPASVEAGLGPECVKRL